MAEGIDENIVIREVRINYVFATPDNWNKVELACSELGWSKASILKQMIHGFMAVDGVFYARAGILDAEARGMKEEDYFRTLRDGTDEDLSRYIAGRPAFGKAPIDDIDLVPAIDENKHRYNIIGLSAYNYVLLRVAQIVDGGAMVQVVSRMIVKHLQDKWGTNYQPQIDRDQRCKFL
jgi:hypothetical protein